MKHVVELDPELVAFRTVASLYAEEAFEHGVFRVPLGAHSGGNLWYLQATCEQNVPLQDRTRPSDSFKQAVGKLARIRKLPSLLCTAGFTEISELARGVYDSYEELDDEQIRGVFDDAPNNVEAYLVKQAKAQVVNYNLFDGHPESGINVPEIFERVLPEAGEFYKLYARSGRYVNLLGNAKEYLVGSNGIRSGGTTLTLALEPLAHCSIVDWEDNQQKLVEAFIEEHGDDQSSSDYESISVGLDHVDDIVVEAKELTNDNTDQVARQFGNLFTQICKIRLPYPA